MKIEINIEKRHLYFVIALVCVLFIITFSFAQSSVPNPGHSAESVGAGTFGADAGGGDYVFPGKVPLLL